MFLSKLKYLPVVALLCMTLQPAEGLSSDWQPRASINKPGDEVTTGSWNAVQTIDVRNTNGLTIGVLPGKEHTLHVEGTWQFQTWAGTSRLADAFCAIDLYDPAAGPNWQADRWDHLVNPGWLELKARDGGVARRIDWKPYGSDPSVPVNPGCSSTNHYTATFVPTSNEVSFFADDPWVDDSLGELKLSVTGPGWEAPYQCGKKNETPVVPNGQVVGAIQAAHVTVDSRRSPGDFPDPASSNQLDHWSEAGHWGIYTCNWALPTDTYKITVTGTFRYAFTEDLKTRRAMADAECARDAEGGPRWWPNFYEPTQDADDLLDLYVNRKAVAWKPVMESKNHPGCSDIHMYTLDNWTPEHAGPIHLRIYDVNYAEHDNVGELHVMIERTGPDATEASDYNCTLPPHLA